MLWQKLVGYWSSISILQYVEGWLLALAPSLPFLPFQCCQSVFIRKQSVCCVVVFFPSFLSVLPPREVSLSSPCSRHGARWTWYVSAGGSERRTTTTCGSAERRRAWTDQSWLDSQSNDSVSIWFYLYQCLRQLHCIAWVKCRCSVKQNCRTAR